MSGTIDDITINYEEDDVLIVKELDKIVLSKGAWTTILFRYQNWNREKEMYGQEMYTIRRYKKVGGEYRAQSKFNISSREQAQKIVDALTVWLNEETPES